MASVSLGRVLLLLAVYRVVRKRWHPGLIVCDELYRRFAIAPAHHQTAHVLTNDAVFRGTLSCHHTVGGLDLSSYYGCPSTVGVLTVPCDTVDDVFSQ